MNMEAQKTEPARLRGKWNIYKSSQKSVSLICYILQQFSTREKRDHSEFKFHTGIANNRQNFIIYWEVGFRCCKVKTQVSVVQPLLPPTPANAIAYMEAAAQRYGDIFNAPVISLHPVDCPGYVRFTIPNCCTVTVCAKAFTFSVRSNTLI